MADKWRVVTLGDVADLVRGVSYRPSDLLADGAEGIPLLRATNIKNQALELADVLFVPPALVRDHQRLRRFDVVIAMSSGSRDAVGRLAQLRRDWVGCVGAFCGVVRADPKRVHPEYLGYVLQSPAFRTHVETRAVGTAIMNLSRDRILGFTLRLPDLPEQSAIAHILGTLDDKIELNRKQNETLEAMARALFKAWFVDFEPVRAKMEGRWQRGQSLPGLPAHLYDLFPDRLVDSELGEIPEEWEVTAIDGEFDVTMGQSPPGSTYNETGDGLPFYQGRADFEFRFPKRRVYCTAPTRFAKKGDTLVSVRAPVGDINMASEDCAIGRGVAAVRHKTGCRSYTYQFMNSISDVFARFDSEGTVFGSIGKKDFHAITHVSPSHDLVLAYEGLAAPLDDQIERNERESRYLAQLRDTLLPKLISGELRLKDAAKLVEAEKI